MRKIKKKKLTQKKPFQIKGMESKREKKGFNYESWHLEMKQIRSSYSA